MKIPVLNIELDLTEASNWSTARKGLTALGLFVAVLVVGGILDTREQLENLEVGQQKEIALKREFAFKQNQAANLDEFTGHVRKLQTTFELMLTQLPNRSEIDDLLEDITKLGKSGGLKFELFQPQAEKKQLFFAELPVKINVLGDYHQFGQFSSALSAMPRIALIDDFTIERDEKTRVLRLDAYAKTFRYLDPSEQQVAKK